MRPRRSRHLSAEKLLLAVEFGAVVLFFSTGAMLWQTQRELNSSYRNLQRNAPQAMPTIVAAANPATFAESLAQVSQASVLKPPLPTPFPTVTPQPVAQAEWDQQMVQAPTPAGQQSQNDARNTATTVQKRSPVTEAEQSRLKIPAIGIDNFIFRYDGPQSLKLGVVQVGQAVAPGEAGNLVLAAHNDIYGEIFRDLDELKMGDELFLLGDDRSYTYRVRDTLVVEPDDIWVMQPTSTPTVTLVSCYPYLMDTHRIVVFADLVQ